MTDENMIWDSIEDFIASDPYYKFHHHLIHVTDAIYCPKLVWFRTHLEPETVEPLYDRGPMLKPENYEMTLGTLIHAGVLHYLSLAHPFTKTEFKLDPVPIDGKFLLIGKADAVIPTSMRTATLLEVKTIRWIIEEFEPPEHHIMQLSLYKYMLDRMYDDGIVNFTVEQCKLLYINRSPPSRRGRTWIPKVELDVEPEDVRIFLDHIKYITKVDEYPRPLDCGWKRKYCPFADICTNEKKEGTSR